MSHSRAVSQDSSISRLRVECGGGGEGESAVGGFKADVAKEK